MTCARKHLAPRGLPGRYHCTARCVRRAWLCGVDPYSGKNFDHRRQWVEDRITFLAELFAVSVMSYAVMSNHLHVVLEIRPDAAEKDRSSDSHLGLVLAWDSHVDAWLGTAMLLGTAAKGRNGFFFVWDSHWLGAGLACGLAGLVGLGQPPKVGKI
jgi:hypothetical protein